MSQSWAFIADLQTECWSKLPAWLNEPLTKSVDGYFLGGDIGHIDDTAELYYRWIDTLHKCRQQTTAPIFYVLGNHEYYGAPDAKRVQRIAQEICHSLNITLLNRSTATWGRYRVSGCTLWTPAQDTDPSYHLAKLGIDLATYRARHEQDRRWLLAQPKSNLILTHYPPTCRLLPTAHGMYCNLLWPELLAPPIWWCGHVHKNLRLSSKDGAQLVSHSLGRPEEQLNCTAPAYGSLGA